MTWTCGERQSSKGGSVSQATISKSTEMDQHNEDHAATDSAFRKHWIKPTREEIEQGAYKLFLARGAVDGHDLEDWLQAEQELQKRGEYWMLL
jgi:hypothetical protein